MCVWKDCWNVDIIWMSQFVILVWFVLCLVSCLYTLQKHHHKTACYHSGYHHIWWLRQRGYRSYEQTMNPSMRRLRWLEYRSVPYVNLSKICQSRLLTFVVFMHVYKLASGKLPIIRVDISDRLPMREYNSAVRH